MTPVKHGSQLHIYIFKLNFNNLLKNGKKLRKEKLMNGHIYIYIYIYIYMIKNKLKFEHCFALSAIDFFFHEHTQEFS